MTTLSILFAASGFAALLAAAVIRLRPPYRPKRKVVIHTRDDQSVEGLLVRSWGPVLALRGARLLHPDATAQGIALEGEVLIERKNISFVQAV